MECRMPSLLRALGLLALCAHSIASLAQDQRSAREQVVSCRKNAWVFTEHRVLGGWAWAANGKNTEDLAAHIDKFKREDLVADYSIRVGDNRVLEGRRLSFSKERPKVAVLVVPGNLALADTMIIRMLPIAHEVRHDYFFVDYRGYGRSPGFPSLRALIDDQVEIGANLRKLGYERVVGYGFSFGGIILVNAVRQGLALDRLIVDSVPADLEDYDCESNLSPVNAVPSICADVTAITSEKDREIPPADQKQFLDRIVAPDCGGRIRVLRTAIHAFNDKLGSAGDKERRDTIAELLAGD